MPESNSKSPPTNAAGPRRQKRGRPADTDQKQDRRIVDAWKSGEYKSYEDLARALGLARRDVELACERERKRRKK